MKMKEFATDFIKLQAEFDSVPKNAVVKVTTRTGGEYSFKYATYDTIVSYARPILAKHGFAFMQLAQEGYLVTRLLHKSGEFVDSSLKIPEHTDIKEFGGAITYLRRYGLSAALGLVTDDDDDGNVASGDTAVKTADEKPWYNDFDKHKDAMLDKMREGATDESIIANLTQHFKVNKKVREDIKALYQSLLGKAA